MSPTPQPVTAPLTRAAFFLVVSVVLGVRLSDRGGDLPGTSASLRRLHYRHFATARHNAGVSCAAVSQR
jgi:hypothetical protein